MRAAAICDFYMTKYHAKAQQVLSSALPSLIAGLRRCETEEQEMEEGSVALRDKALKRLRRLMFAANKSHWFSAAELSIYVLTGGHCILTHKDVPLFTSRLHYMAQECKRFLNKDDLLTMCAVRRQGAQQQVVDALVVVAAEPCLQGDTSGAANAADDDNDESRAEAEIHVFKSTTSIIDDWLHRGPTLIDFTLDQYVMDIERVKVTFESAMDCQSIVIPFEQHYALSKIYAQRRRIRKVLPRIVGPQCGPKKDNDGESHALYMHLLFTPLRCLGRDQCADCRNFAGLLFPAANGKHSFKTAWKARRAHVNVLAAYAEQKINRAKRVPVPDDTTLWKQWKPDGEQCDAMQVEFREPPMLTLLLLKLFGARCAADAGSVDLDRERLKDGVLGFLGVSSGHHDDQLYLSEYVAYKARQRIFNIELDVEAKNTIVAEATKLKDCIVEDPVVLDEAKNVMQFEDVGGNGEIEDDDTPQAEGSNAVMISEQFFDCAAVVDLLCRRKEIAATTKPGRHADANVRMRDYAKTFDAILKSVGEKRSLKREVNVCFHADVAEMLQTQAAKAQAVRLQKEPVSVDAAESIDSGNIASVPEVTSFSVDDILQGPAALAWKLACDAKLNKDQLRAVSLIVDVMQQEFARVLAEKPESLNAEADPLANIANRVEVSISVLPLVGVLTRVLLVGGGGCGKSRIINAVLKPLLRAFYGRDGLMLAGPSNKSARNIGGVTLHKANGLLGNSSLLAVHLRPTSQQQAYVRKMYRLGAKVFDEFSQILARLFHADAYKTSLARQAAQSLLDTETHIRIDSSRYADMDQSWGSLPIVLAAGDELQFPPIPKEGGLLAPIEGTSDEQKVAARIFSNFTHVYRLTTAMRFHDETLIEILRKMRLEGGCKLKESEWQALHATEVKKPEDLHGTELWYESAYEWSIVCMSTVVRSQLSAKVHGTTLFVIQAKDEILNTIHSDATQTSMDASILRRKLSEAILQHPNMNETGRLPSFAMLHIGMKVRFTQTVEDGFAVIDDTGVVLGFEFHENELVQHKLAAEQASRPIVLLRYMPLAVYVRVDKPDGSTDGFRFFDDKPCDQHAATGVDHKCKQCLCMKNVVAVPPCTNKRAWSLDLNSPQVKVKGKRTQTPLVCLQPSTLHVLQGCTTDPGLIFHWKFPRMLSQDLRWLAVYVALSRVRALKNLRSVGLTTKIRGIIEEGPPATIPAQFKKYFAATELKTQKAADAAMKRLGWDTKEIQT